MDAIRLKVLQAEVKAQLAEIENVYETLAQRTGQWSPNAPASVESVAYQLHNLYNAVEDLMKLVANAFENSVTDSTRWHTQLLNRMTLEIEGVRPALFAANTAVHLHELRAFRHFFRHAYRVSLDHVRVEQNVQKAQELRPLLARDVDTFLASLQVKD